MATIGPTPNLALGPPLEQKRAAKLSDATQQFESMLLRRVLSALEKTARVSSTGAGPAGASAYGSMVVEALSDAIAQAGGMGLARDMASQLQPAPSSFSNASGALRTKAQIPLKASGVMPFSSVRATPTESNPVLVNRRTE